MATRSNSFKRALPGTEVATIFANEIDRAVRELKSGGVIAFPTETVYGLGADASNPAAIGKIFTIKGRPADHPLIVHIRDATQLSQWCDEVPDAAYRLAETFWPGPLTLILPHSKAPLAVTGGQRSIGLRAPRHPVAQNLLEAFGGGIAAPSANRFGRISPTQAAHVREELGDRVDIILEGGDCEVGLESTILSLATESPCLLRPGAITRSDLESVLGQRILGRERAEGIRASGLLESHYAPRTRLRLSTPATLEAMIGGNPQRTALITLKGAPSYEVAQQVSLSEDPAEYGNRLYATLRSLDSGRFDLIVAETPPTGEAWAAVHDRLCRASHDSSSLNAETGSHHDA